MYGAHTADVWCPHSRCMVPTQQMYGAHTADVWCGHNTCVMFKKHMSHVRVTFWSSQHQIFIILGTGWDMFGDTLGMVWDGLVMIFGRCSENLDTTYILELSGSIFPVMGCSKQSLLGYSRVNKTNI